MDCGLACLRQTFAERHAIGSAWRQAALTRLRTDPVYEAPPVTALRCIEVQNVSGNSNVSCVRSNPDPYSRPAGARHSGARLRICGLAACPRGAVCLPHII